MNNYTVFYKIEAITSSFNSSIAKVESKISALSKRMEAINAGAMSVSNSALTTSRNVGLATAAMSIPILKFEKSMNRMVASAGSTHEAMAPLIGLTKQLGKSTEHSATAAMDAAIKLTQAGFNQNESLKLLPQTLQLASAGALDMATSASIVSDSIKAFSLETSESQRVVDVLAKGATMAKLDVQDFGQVIGKVGGIATLQNQSFEKTMAMFMAIKDTGLDASTSATGLGSIMQMLSKPTADAQRAFNELGIDINKMIENGAQFDQILGALSKKTMTSAQLTSIFGREQGRTGNAVAKNYKIIGKYTKALQASQGAAKKMQETMMVGVTGALARFKSALEGLMLKTGSNGLSGALQTLFITLTQVMVTLDAMNLNWELIIKSVFALTGALIALGIVARVVAALTMLVKGLSIAFAVLNFIINANPAVRIITAVIASVTILLIYLDKVKVVFDTIKNGISKVMGFFGKDKGLESKFNISKDAKLTTDIDMDRAIDSSLGSRAYELAKQSVTVNSNSNVTGNITIENNNEDYTAKFNNLNFGIE